MRTDEEIVIVGEYARNLATDETFNALYKEYTDAMLSRIVESAPHETKAREFEYAQLRAMTGFVNHLVSLAEAATKIIEKNNQPDLDPEDAGEELED